MDFFAEQERARRSTKWLVLLFLLAVAAIIGAVYLAILFFFGRSGPGPEVTWWHPELFGWTALGVLLLVSFGTLTRIAALARGGGAAVAETLGAEPVSRATEELLERRLLNVVDEMAIASGVPTPTVFVLRDEPGINAFAAGFTPDDAVVAVTRGCLEQLSRDELQGVVAHEFSHIFNGDMLLNIRLMGLLHGILLIAGAGRAILRGSGRSRSRNSGGGALFGLSLLLIGYIGVFFGHLIKAAVSRQREFLADASAVQYTRNPDGIAGALKKIGGFTSRIDHPSADEASHMFFGEGVGSLFGRLLATHPPLAERVARIEPAFIAYQQSLAEAGTAAPPAAMGFAAGRVAVDPAAVSGSIGNADSRHLGFAAHVIGQLSESLYADLNRPDTVEDVVYALLLGDGREAALGEAIGGGFPEERIARVLKHAAWLREAGREALRLPVAELALPALQELPRERLDQVLENVDRLVKADGRFSIFELALTSILEHSLKERRPGRRARRLEVPVIRGDIGYLLSVVAHAGHADEQRVRAAFEAAIALAPLEGPWELSARRSLSAGRLMEVLERLGELNIGFKRKLIEACVAAIAADGSVAVAEAELLRAIGARLNCPVPPLLAGEFPTEN